MIPKMGNVIWICQPVEAVMVNDFKVSLLSVYCQPRRALNILVTPAWPEEKEFRDKQLIAYGINYRISRLRGQVNGGNVTSGNKPGPAIIPARIISAGNLRCPIAAGRAVCARLFFRVEWVAWQEYPIPRCGDEIPLRTRR